MTSSRIQQSYTKIGTTNSLAFLQMKLITLHSQQPILQLQVEMRLELSTP